MDQNDIDEGIANEIRVIEEVCANGGHPNVINVLQHRWLNGGERYIFDMELCAMNLEQFINGGISEKFKAQFFNPLSNGGLPDCLKLWSIMRHITLGLQHIHSLGEVH